MKSRTTSTLHKILLSGMAAALLSNAHSAIAHEAGDIIIRAGVASVNPDEDSSYIRPAVVSSAGQVSLDNDHQLGLTFTYMLSRNWGLEVLAATPFTHTVNFAGDLAGLGDLAEAKHLPPTISLQYFPDIGSQNFSPYIGVGLNYTMMLETRATANGRAVLDSVGTGGDHAIDADDSSGLSLELGFDYHFDEHWLVNAAIWKMDIDTTITVANTLKVDVDIDPWVYMLGFGYKF